VRKAYGGRKSGVRTHEKRKAVCNANQPKREEGSKEKSSKPYSAISTLRGEEEILAGPLQRMDRRGGEGG